MGDLVLRKRWDPTFDKEVYEIKLDDEYLMSSLFTVAGEELARSGIARCAGTGPLDIAVGGPGLGYTALTALADLRLGSLTVIDALPEVIEWHRSGLIPAGSTLTADERCTLVQGDFFAGEVTIVAGLRLRRTVAEIVGAPRLSRLRRVPADRVRVGGEFLRYLSTGGRHFPAFWTDNRNLGKERHGEDDHGVCVGVRRRLHRL